jgi:hypothetical protein
MFEGEGEHQIKVLFNDNIWTKNITVDTTAPTLVIVHARKSGLNHEISWSIPANKRSDEVITYRLYRGTSADFNIENNATIIAETTDQSYNYQFDETGTFYYKVIAIDQALNPSPLSSASEKIFQINAGTITEAIIIAASIAAAGVLAGLAVKRYKKFYGLTELPITKAFKKFEGQLAQKIKQIQEVRRSKMAPGDTKEHDPFKNTKKSATESDVKSDSSTNSEDLSSRDIISKYDSIAKKGPEQKKAPISEAPKAPTTPPTPPKETPKELQGVKSRLSASTLALLGKDEVPKDKSVPEGSQKPATKKTQPELKNEDSGWT